MTREEFVDRQAEAREKIQQQCIPWGRIYAVWMGMISGVLISLVCLIWSFCIRAGSLAYAVFAGEVVICSGSIVIANWFYKRNVRRYVRWNVDCPSCHWSLVFPRKWEREEIAQNRCPHCQEILFEGAPLSIP